MRRLARGPGLGAALALLAACSGPRFREGGPWPPPRAGMVVCQEPRATAAGVAILERGGNAADAAVAVALALAVVHPQAGNLGGGGFAVWVAHDPAVEPLFLDFRECAPRELTSAMFLDADGKLVPERSLETGLAVGVPGSPRGLFDFHQKLGRLPFREVVAPALHLAREGFEVDRWLAEDLAEERDTLAAHPGSRALFWSGDRTLPVGAHLSQPELARTLERLAAEGADAFYLGEVAQRIVAEVQNEGGVLSLDDMADYRALWRPPLRGWFRGLEIVTAPPPSSGGIALLQMLSMLDGFPLDEERMRARADDPADPVGLSSRALHWWVESMRMAFADRAEYLGDPDFTRVPVEALLSPVRIHQLRVGIGELANPRVHALPAGPAAREGGQTTHLSVLDPEGNAVSLTTTLNTTFGSGILARGAGVLLNDEIDDFSIQAGTPNAYGLVGGAANALEPRKRPLSSMTPVVVRDGGQVVKYVLGSPGGPTIITSVLQVLLRTVVYGQDLATAVAAPRLHQQWRPSATKVEPGWSDVLVQGLKNRDHEITQATEPWGSVQAIAVEVGGEPAGVSDPRTGGAAQRARPRAKD